MLTLAEKHLAYRSAARSVRRWDCVARLSLGMIAVALAVVVLLPGCKTPTPTAQQNIQSAQQMLTLGAADVTDRSLRIDGHANSVHAVTATQPVASIVEPHIVAIHAETVGLRADAAQEKAVADGKLADSLKQIDILNAQNATLAAKLASKEWQLIYAEVAGGILLGAIAAGLCWFQQWTWGIGLAIVGSVLTIGGETLIHFNRALSLGGLAALILAGLGVIIYELAKNKTAAAGYISAFDVVTKDVESWTEDRWQGVVNAVERLLGKKTVAVANAVRATQPALTVAAIAVQPKAA